MCYNTLTDPFAFAHLPITMADPAPPVILLAFARSEDPRFQGLPRLPEEARLLREALEPAEAAGQIKLEIRQDATLDDILRAFDRYRGRIAIFHFAGHTDDETLLAERLLGAEALLAAVHAQSELKLVFLNACENQAQAAGLHAAGVPAAIVTTEEVEDDLCPAFAVRFYRALAGGFTLAEAFDKARLAAEGEAFERSGGFDHGPWLLSTPDPAAGAWRLPLPARDQWLQMIEQQYGQQVQHIDTQGAAYIGGSVNTGGGNFAGGNLTVVQQAPAFRPPLDLPEPAPHFQDREAELARLVADIQPGQVITLCGPGGIGKTSLAAEAIRRLASANELVSRFPDGVLFHTFYHQPTADEAFQYIATAFGEEMKPTAGLAAKRALSGRTALLVLDGTENARSPDDLAAVRAIRGKCGVLVTSRARDDALDRREDVKPLPLDDAVVLLQAWGGKRAADRGAAVRICELVGELPLAVRLAGSVLSKEELDAADYLHMFLEKTPLSGLNRGQRQAESVPLLLQRSTERLSETARNALGVVGLLAFAPFDRAPIAAALDISTEAATAALGELVRYSLVSRPGDSYEVTHRLVHTYARTQAAPGAAVINRLALILRSHGRGRERPGTAGLCRPRLPPRPHRGCAGGSVHGRTVGSGAADYLGDARLP